MVTDRLISEAAVKALLQTKIARLQEQLDDPRSVDATLGVARMGMISALKTVDSHLRFIKTATAPERTNA